MKKILLILALVGLVASSAMASVMQNPVQAYIEGTAPGDPRSPVNLNYDNWTNPSSLWVGSYQNGTSEVGDDLAMVNVGAGWLDSMGFSVVNFHATEILNGGQGAITFYDMDYNPVLDVTGMYNGFLFNLPPLTTAPGSSNRIFFAAGSLESRGYYLPANVIVCTSWVTGTFSGGTGTAADMGVQLRDPINVGSSTDEMVDITAGQVISFGGSPLANMAYFINTDFTPEPATIMLLGFGALALIRRR